MEINNHLQAQAILCPWGINRPDILCVLGHRPFYVRGILPGHEDECNYGGPAPLLLKHVATWRSTTISGQAILCPWGINRPYILCVLCHRPFYVHGTLTGHEDECNY